MNVTTTVKHCLIPHDANYERRLHSSLAIAVFGSVPFLSSKIVSLLHWTFSPTYITYIVTTESHVTSLSPWHRIDGDATGTVLVQTVMSEKETCIVGGQGRAKLLPASELGKYEKEEKERER